MNEDHVDRILQQWARERPGLETEAMGILGRIQRIAATAGEAMGRTFARHGISGADFDVLATLRRSGEPFELSPGELSSELMLTSGGMTRRLDQLEQRGLTTRSPDPHDRRARVVTLTDHGHQLIDEVVEAAVQTQQRLLSSLPPSDRQQLNDLLRQSLHAVSREASLPPSSNQT